MLSVKLIGSCRTLQITQVTISLYLSFYILVELYDRINSNQIHVQCARNGTYGTDFYVRLCAIDIRVSRNFDREIGEIEIADSITEPVSQKH